jgi:hypothetical protein
MSRWPLYQRNTDWHWIRQSTFLAAPQQQIWSASNNLETNNAGGQINVLRITFINIVQHRSPKIIWSRVSRWCRSRRNAPGSDEVYELISGLQRDTGRRRIDRAGLGWAAGRHSYGTDIAGRARYSSELTNLLTQDREGPLKRPQFSATPCWSITTNPHLNVQCGVHVRLKVWTKCSAGSVRFLENPFWSVSLP